MRAKGRSPTSAIAPPASIENHAGGQSPSQISIKLLGCQQSRWPSFCETRSPPGFLRDAPPNGRASHCPDNTPVCASRFGSLLLWLRSGSKATLAALCIVPADAGLCPPDKRSDFLPADRGTHLVATGPAGWFRSVHFPTPRSPKNPSPSRPTSRYCLAWCSRRRPPSVAVFSSAALPHDPPPAVAA